MNGRKVYETLSSEQKLELLDFHDDGGDPPKWMSDNMFVQDAEYPTLSLLGGEVVDLCGEWHQAHQRNITSFLEE